MIIILGLFEWCQIARITRAETLTLKERDYVLAAKHLGANHKQIIFKHIIPNMSSSIIVAGKSCSSECNPDRISTQFHGTWRTASESIVGNNASGSTDLYYG